MENYKKKYEHALDNFKKIKAINKDNNELVDFIEYEYPELKEENEDERIRRGLIAQLSQDKELHHKEIAWLEKQGLQKQRKEWDADDLWNYNQIMHILQDYNQTELMDWLEKQSNLIESYEDKLDRCASENFDKGYKATLEKQDKQNLRNEIQN